jgi:catechol 2,3-dioxygenase-like lactoylglutathione lyase family enzyme
MRVVLGQAMIFVADMARMQAFYRDVLGLGIIDETPGFSRYDAGGARLALHLLPAEIGGAVASPPPVREDCAIKLTFRVADVPTWRAKLDALGCRMGKVHTWDGRSFCDGSDPEGNVFQIADG